jgi:high-affinity nickel permease
MITLDNVVTEVGKENKKHRRLFRFLEFFVVGFLLGVGEDIAVIVLATDDPITSRTLLVAVVVALPFAVLSELIVDKPEVRNFLQKRYSKFFQGAKRVASKKR